MITLAQLNALAAADFVETLGGVFEHSAWVAQRAVTSRPFDSRLQLLDAMRAAVDQASGAQQLALIRAHPQLAVPAHRLSPLTAASAGEQRRAGLDSCTPADGLHLESLNARYLDRFGFPFVLAVRGHDPESIIANFEQRLGHDAELERATALGQIGTIAAYRLADMIVSSPGPEIVAMLGKLQYSVQAPGAQAGTATALMREWMQSAGLDVSAPAGGYLIARVASADSTATTLLAGVCRDPLFNTVHYDGSTVAIIAIEVARQLRQLLQIAADPALALAILARPEDPRSAGPDSVVSWAWMELTGADAADSEGGDIMRVMESANLPRGQALLVRRRHAGGAVGAGGNFTALAAGQAARALQAALAPTHSVA
ncbi:MAG TPA: 2-oxo-4-hydroxy-4-carboxy-5-ureidoimidazoline decarboxylase [Steroidobacteraceae bacterium]